jgi:hypothetical protein
MQEIVDSVKHVADIMSEIAAASNEQSSGIGEVNGAINHMDEMTQQNASLVEQAAAAAASMQEQAGSLMQVVSVFKLAQNATVIAMPVHKTVAAPVVHRVATPKKSVKRIAGSRVRQLEWEEL